MPGPYQQPPPGRGAYQHRPGPMAPPPRPQDQPTRQYEQPPAPPPYDHAPPREPDPPYEPPYEPQPYDPPRSHEPYEPPPRREPRRYSQPDESPVAYQRERDRRAALVTIVANTIHVVTAIIALCFVLHIVFVLFGANQGSGIVSFVSNTTKVFVLGFGDVFTPSNATLRVVVTDGLAAIIYAVVGRLIATTLRR